MPRRDVAAMLELTLSFPLLRAIAAVYCAHSLPQWNVTCVTTRQLLGRVITDSRVRHHPNGVRRYRRSGQGIGLRGSGSGVVVHRRALEPELERFPVDRGDDLRGHRRVARE